LIFVNNVYIGSFCQQILGQMAHNVPAVYDVLTARIRALRSKDQGWQNVPEQRRGNEAKRNDLAIAEAEPPTAAKRKQTCYVPLGFYTISFLFRILCNDTILQ
jgi:hypothetical protein